MNRIIKFRAWDNVDYMSTPFTLQDVQSKKIQLTSDCVLMQFTGLHDKDGKEIYEGDVCFHPKYKHGKIVYNQEECGYTVEYTDLAFTLHEMLHLEVIGNIFENPDLIK